jgi:glycosyltransferase involved in cell wall biosynthesis
LKIGFDAKRAYSNSTGLGTYSRLLLDHLGKYFPQHQYFLFSPKSHSTIWPLHNTSPFSTISNKTFWPDSLWRSFFLSSQIKNLKLDLFHGLSHEIPLGLKPQKIKTVVTIHDLIYLTHPHLFPWIDRKIYDAKFRHSCRQADQIIAVSEFTKLQIATHFKTPEKKIHVIYQAIDDHYFLPPTNAEIEQIKQKYLLPASYLFYAGTLNERKNALVILKALKLMAPIDRPSLLLAGSGKEYKKKCQQFVVENQLESWVKFLGFVPDHELKTLYHLAKVFIYPSQVEGFGLPIVEAQAQGTPVITSHGGCFAEAGGDHSIKIDPNNPHDLKEKIDTLFQDTQIYQSLKAPSLLHAQKFHGENQAQKLIKFYSQL